MSDDSEDPKLGKEEEGSKPWWQEAVKEMTLNSLATLFMTEDSIRSMLREKKFPKEMMGQLLEGVGKKKDDFYGLLVKEVGKVFAKVDLSKEFAKFLETHEVEVSAKLKFAKREGNEEEPK